MIIGALDEQSLGSYLEGHIDGFRSLKSVEKFTGGQSNPTFLLTADSGKYVLRRKPPGDLLPSAHAVDREFRVIQALGDTAVPVATVYHLCEDNAVIGSMFYIMSYEQGRIFWDPALPDSSREERGGIYEEVVSVLAAMHNVDVDAVGLEDFGKPGNYFQRQIGRWTKQYRASETETLEAMEMLIQWLPDNIPEEDEKTCLIHGDYRIDNLVFHPSRPQVIAVLDWELSTLGHPFADLAYLCMCLRLPDLGHMAGLQDKNRHDLGIPDEKDIVRKYCELRELPEVENWHFYLVFSFFRIAAIVQGVLKRALSGNASSEQALQVGRQGCMLAEMAVELIDN